MNRDNRHISNQDESEIDEESLMKLRKDVTDLVAEIGDFLTECGYTEPERTGKIEVDVVESKLQETVANQDVTALVAEIDDFLTECGYTEPESTDKIEVDVNETVQETVANYNETLRVPDIHVESQGQSETQFRAKREDGGSRRERIVVMTQNNKPYAHIETPVPVVSNNRKRKLEVDNDNEPSMERLVQPEKRRVVIDLRQFKKQDDHRIFVTIPRHACAPREDLRKVLQRRRGLCG